MQTNPSFSGIHGTYSIYSLAHAKTSLIKAAECVGLSKTILIRIKCLCTNYQD